MARPMASSAVGSVRRSGTKLTLTPACAQAIRSKLSYPFNAQAMVLSRGAFNKVRLFTRSGMNAIMASASLPSSLFLFQMFAKRRPNAVDHEHAYEDGQQNGGDLVVLDQAQSCHEFEANAARTHDAHHCRCAKVIFPSVDGDVRQLGQNLR